jgi:hypothetical protein
MGQQAGRFNTLNFIRIDWFNKRFILVVSSAGNRDQTADESL